MAYTDREERREGRYIRSMIVRVFTFADRSHEFAIPVRTYAFGDVVRNNALGLFDDFATLIEIGFHRLIENIAEKSANTALQLLLLLGRTHTAFAEVAQFFCGVLIELVHVALIEPELTHMARAKLFDFILFDFLIGAGIADVFFVEREIQEGLKRQIVVGTDVENAHSAHAALFARRRNHVLVDGAL